MEIKLSLNRTNFLPLHYHLTTTTLDFFYFISWSRHEWSKKLWIVAETKKEKLIKVEEKLFVYSQTMKLYLRDIELVLNGIYYSLMHKASHEPGGCNFVVDKGVALWHRNSLQGGKIE